MALTAAERELLAETAARFAAGYFELTDRVAANSCSDFDSKQWARYADLGWLGLSVSTEYGGAGGGCRDLIVLMEEVGSGLMMEPILSTAVIAVQIVEALGSATQCARVLPRICEGDVTIAFGYMEPSGGFGRTPATTRVSSRDRGLRLTGRKIAVTDAQYADYLIVTANQGNDKCASAAYIISSNAPGIHIESARGIDDRAICTVDLREVEVSTDDCLADGNVAQAIEATLNIATVCVCAEAVGAMRAANRHTIEHLQARRQFGRPLSDFQALRHRLADMKIAEMQARSVTRTAAAALDDNLSIAPQLVSAAKIICDRAALFVGSQAIQLHGAMGLTEEHVISHLDRRLLWATSQFGDVAWHIDRMCASPGIYQ